MAKFHESHTQRPSLVKQLSFRSQTLRRLKQLHHVVFAAFACGLTLYALSRRNASPTLDWRHPELQQIASEDAAALPEAVQQLPLDSLKSASDLSSSGSVGDSIVDDFELVDGDQDDDAEAEDDGDEAQDDYDFDDEVDEDEYGYDESDLDADDNHEIFSMSTRLRKPLPLFFDGVGTTDPSIIPHPMRHNEWLVMAKDVDSDDYVVCPAGVLDDVLICTEPFEKLEESSSIRSSCSIDGSGLTQRIFYGPDAPFAMSMFGSQQDCAGSWLQDARMNLDAFRLEKYTLVKAFRDPVALAPKGNAKSVDQNSFVFWDAESKPYLHQSLWPTREFAAISASGHLGSDLAVEAAHSDRVCMAKYMPSILHSQSEHEQMQQATNSLSVTLCRRKDSHCVPNDSNTVIMHIVQKITDYEGHAVAEPYVVLFNRTAPFAIHAIAERPFWIHGRGPLTKDSETIQYEGRESEIPEGHTEMYNVASISWKTHGLKYHGYIDDVLFIGFGIERSRGGAIDVQALDLLQDMSYC